ncbi:MAG: metallophosphoesterase family protein [Dehalococcoidales bacterium]|jgi:predicted phosphodiesterase
MRCAILADIHSNATALMAVLEDADRRGGVDELWCLGDIVGYGPDPHRCLEILRQFKCVGVCGNHDLAAIEKTGLASFDPDAAQAIRWTMRQISTEDALFLSRLQPRVEKDEFTLVHGSPRQPVWEYMVSLSSARENFPCFSTPYCLVGHTHIPMGFKKESAAISALPLSENIGQVLGKASLILNPGSVGQPRDNDPRASYATLDSDSGIFRLHRVPYDVAAVRERMWGCGLPVRLASRLEHGV